MVDMETIQGYLPKEYPLSAHAVKRIKDVGGGYSYDEERGVWLVRFPKTSLGLRTAARFYCGVIRNGYTISSDDKLREAIFEYFKVNHFDYLPAEIWDGAII